MRTTKIVKFVLPLLLLAVGLFGFNYLRATRPEQPASTPREKVWVVETVPALPQRLAPSLTLYGKVETPALMQPAAPGPGVVQTVTVREGDSVSRGQPLLELDPRDFEPALADARAEVADLRAQIAELRLRAASDGKSLEQEQRLLQLARNAVDRARRLQRQKLGSDSTLDQAEEALGRQELAMTARQLAVDSARARLEQLQARLRRGEARLATARLALERSRVLAPFDGVVTGVRVAAGDRVQASQVLLSLYALDALEIRARLAARYQSEIQVALARGDRLRASAGLPGLALELELVRLAGAAEASGIDAFFRVVGPVRPLRPGNLLELSLARPPQDRVLALPFQAIYGNSRVYLLKEERMFGVEVEAIGTYEDGGGEAALLVRSDAIAADDRIIVTHLPNAVTGLKVRTPHEPGGRAALAAPGQRTATP